MVSALMGEWEVGGSTRSSGGRGAGSSSATIEGGGGGGSVTLNGGEEAGAAVRAALEGRELVAATWLRRAGRRQQCSSGARVGSSPQHGSGRRRGGSQPKRCVCRFLKRLETVCVVQHCRAEVSLAFNILSTLVLVEVKSNGPNVHLILVGKSMRILAEGSDPQILDYNRSNALNHYTLSMYVNSVFKTHKGCLLRPVYKGGEHDKHSMDCYQVVVSSHATKTQIDVQSTEKRLVSNLLPMQ